jgi:acyl carrier protein phosphodiesterase
MNFLAHTYLSFTDEQIVGNLMGDFIKNKNAWQELKCNKVIVRNNCVNFTDMYSIQDAAAVYWKKKTGGPFRPITF